ncbi:MAG: acetyltransferase [Ruminococcus sp.]|nr:acetyltransferase [Ruminococcus sp.]
MKRNSNYGIFETIQNVIFVVKTKLLFPCARMVRFPIVIRGKRFIDFGTNLTTGRNCRIEVNGEHTGKAISFGENVNIGDNVSIRCADRIKIGNNVLMGSKVLILDNSHGKYSGSDQDIPGTPPNKRKIAASPVIIEDNVWIGEGAVIQQGVTIGKGSIISANSVVTKDIPEAVIVGGVPARVIKKFDPESSVWRRVREKEL